MSEEYSIFGPPKRTAGASGPDPSRPEILMARLREDLRLAVVNLYALCVCASVGPFAIFRLANGEPLVAFVDSLIVAAFTALALVAWNPERTRLAANATAIVAAASVIGVVLFLGLSPLWLFGTLVGNFLMAERHVALGINTVTVALFAINPDISPDITEHVTLITVAIITSLFSTLFATRVHNQHQQLSRLAERDGLTGALNRRSLDQDLTDLVGNSARSGQTHCLALLDLDDFKALNDQHGHEAGDRALRRLTRLVEISTRENDRFYRYGGEEFVLVLPHTPLEGAGQAMSKLYKALGASESNGDVTVTFSAGLAEPIAGESACEWLARADQALLKAKRAGKNRWEED